MNGITSKRSPPRRNFEGCGIHEPIEALPRCVMPPSATAADRTVLERRMEGKQGLLGMPNLRGL